MKHRITVRAVKKQPPELDRFVAALLALAIARVEAEEAKPDRVAKARGKEARG